MSPLGPRPTASPTPPQIRSPGTVMVAQLPTPPAADESPAGSFNRKNGRSQNDEDERRGYQNGNGGYQNGNGGYRSSPRPSPGDSFSKRQPAVSFKDSFAQSFQQSKGRSSNTPSPNSNSPDHRIDMSGNSIDSSSQGHGAGFQRARRGSRNLTPEDVALHTASVEAHEWEIDTKSLQMGAEVRTPQQHSTYCAAAHYDSSCSTRDPSSTPSTHHHSLPSLLSSLSAGLRPIRTRHHGEVAGDTGRD